MTTNQSIRPKLDQRKVDVLVSGAGPVGLLLSYQLHRIGIHSVCTIDQIDRSSPSNAAAGAASSILPRSLEMLDQLGLCADLAEIGFVARRATAYKEGKQIQNTYWKHEVEGISDTFFDYNLHIRQRHSEEVIRKGLSKLGGKVEAGMKLVNFVVEEDQEYPILAHCVSGDDNEQSVIRAKYIVGCDGGHSAVRKIAGIPFVGEHTAIHWVRVDGIIKTDMPEARAGCVNVESKTHGSVLFLTLDHGATRIGFALSPELYEKYGRHMTAKEAIAEAQRAVAPFSLEYKQVDWHTVYTVQQRVAERLYDQGRVFLAGDAAHTHSSGGAQGMNTGFHDAITLSWRLAGVLKGLYKPEVFETYNTERHEIAWKLIRLDQDMSHLISGQKPKHLTDSTQSASELLGQTMELSAPFILGLGLEYPANFLNRKNDSVPISVEPGQRAPDVAVLRPGYKLLSRLYEVVQLNGKFQVLIFAGAKRSTPIVGPGTLNIRGGISASDVCDTVTVIAGNGPQPGEYLDYDNWGTAVWDPSHSAHIRYGINPEIGGCLVVRPDGILGYAAAMNAEGFAKLGEYLDNVVVTKTSTI